MGLSLAIPCKALCGTSFTQVSGTCREQSSCIDIWYSLRCLRIPERYVEKARYSMGAIGHPHAAIVPVGGQWEYPMQYETAVFWALNCTRIRQ